MIAVMADQAAGTRRDAVEAFAAHLRVLRDSAGNPSFREMAGRSHAISHTTLHEAAQGNRLPSWTTTVEFVKACGADPAEYRERWEQADRAVRAASPASDTAASEPVVDDAVPEPPTQPNRHGVQLALAGVAAAVVAAVVIAIVAFHSGSKSPAADPSAISQSQAGQFSAADCPIREANPPAAPPAHAGDASEFITDITLPDCSHLREGQTAVKVWRLKNIGKVAWKGYSLHRLDLPQQRNQCQTITDVPINPTAPGAIVDIRTEVTAPNSPGFCFVRFKMLDASGNIVFPGSRPVKIQLIVR
jgi:hypothetical protein